MSRAVPAFRTCGVVGFYVAVIVAVGGAMLAGVPALTMSVVALASAASFFIYVYVRKWITGRETLELLDQVWFAEICSAAALYAVGAPVLPHMDVLAVALCFFLAAGRIGCTLVGCCHGRPSSVGFVYGQEQVRDGFPPHLVGIRLFPVPAIEAAGLLVMGGIGLVALPFASVGLVFAWFLTAYAVMRFGLEGLRGDVRPHLLGLSKARWMSLAEFAVGLWIAEGAAVPAGRSAPLLFAILVAALIGALLLRRHFDRPARLLSPAHLAELRDAVRSAADEVAASRMQFSADFSAGPDSAAPTIAGDGGPTRIATRRTSLGTTVAVSREAGGVLHLSIADDLAGADLALLSELAAAAAPPAVVERIALVNGVLHLGLLPETQSEVDAKTLYAAVVRQLQAAQGVGPTRRIDSFPVEPIPSTAIAEPEPSPEAVTGASDGATTSAAAAPVFWMGRRRSPRAAIPEWIPAPSGATTADSRDRVS